MDNTQQIHQPADGLLLRVQDLSIEAVHGKSTNRLVNAVSFGVPEGKITAIVGGSGSGKTLTAMAIMGLLPKDELRVSSQSRIYFRDEDILRFGPSKIRELHGRQMAMVFQEPGSSLNPVLSVGKQIVHPLRQHLGMSNRQAWVRAEELLQEVGIPDPRKKAHLYPHELSGGQQQRVMIAMAIACGPKCLIADEPTSALDVNVQRQILDLFYRLQQDHALTLLFITHDLGIVAEMADKVVVFHDGNIKEQGEKAVLLRAPENAYSKALIASRNKLNSPLPVERAKTERHPDDNRVHTHSLLEVRGLTKNYEGRGWFRHAANAPAVKQVSFTLNKGETLGIVGESGSGKTTVAMAITRLIRVTDGQVLLDGKECLALPASEFRPLRRRIQLIFQNPYASLNPSWPIVRTLTGPMETFGLGQNAYERRKLARLAMEMVGLNECDLDKYPHQFSGGQRQRIAIARALVVQPDVLICDEAVSALDVTIQVQIMDLLLDLQRKLGMAYLFISHDLNAIRYMADRLLVMRSGEVIEEGTVDSVFRYPRHPYTAKLIAAAPIEGELL